jgi:hypothetical protein
MAHNIDLPRHRYIWVIESAVHRKGSQELTVPAVWWGLSATPGRMFGCHVLLESGAMVVDLPLHALRHKPNATHRVFPEMAQRWDAYGWHVEAHEPRYLQDLRCKVLSENHKHIVGTGELWFYVDHIADGYSLEPGQHKHHWVVGMSEGHFDCVPQDMVLVEETSFTQDNGIPPIKRQSKVWSCE